jgi:hypothetical protein
MHVITGGCANARTPGEQFRHIMADIDKQCHKDKLGPYEPIPRKTGVRDSSCDILFLKPQDPLATPEGRFAHSIQLPAPYDKPKEVYKPGMSSAEYFKALCDAEAGDFLFKTVEGVEGVLQMRPYQAEPELLGQFFAYEGIVGNGIAMASNPEGYLTGDRRGYYDFFELPVRSASKDLAYQHWIPVVDEDEPRKKSSRSGVDLTNKMMIENAPTAKYGYTQRGIKRLNDLEYGIRGAELIVLDLHSNQPLGFRRVFRHYYFHHSEMPRQVFSDYCPKGSDGFKFIKEVLVPKVMQHDARIP